VADCPTPEVIRQQNSVWLATWIRAALRVIARDEPSLAKVVDHITLEIARYCASIGHAEPGRMERPCDTWAEQRGER
jgi:hypothetical protein